MINKHYNKYPYRIGLNIAANDLGFHVTTSIDCILGRNYDKTHLYVVTIPDDNDRRTVYQFYNGFIYKSKEIIIEKILPLWDMYTIQQYLTTKTKTSTIDHVMREACKRGCLDIVQYLILIGATLNDRYNIHSHIFTASRYGHLNVVKYLVSIGVDIHNDAALRIAAMEGRLDVVKYLISTGYADIDCALRAASEKGHLNIVKCLIHNGANVHSIDDYAVRWAARNGHLDVVKYLVFWGADAAKDGVAQRWASENGHMDVVRYLVNNINYMYGTLPLDKLDYARE